MPIPGGRFFICEPVELCQIYSSHISFMVIFWGLLKSLDM